MNNLLRLYSNHADAPDIPNQFALQRLFDRRIAYNEKGKLRFEHIYRIELLGNLMAEYHFIKTIDHGGD